MSAEELIAKGHVRVESLRPGHRRVYANTGSLADVLTVVEYLTETDPLPAAKATKREALDAYRQVLLPIR